MSDTESIYSIVSIVQAVQIEFDNEENEQFIANLAEDTFTEFNFMNIERNTVNLNLFSSLKIEQLQEECLQLFHNTSK